MRDYIIAFVFIILVSVFLVYRYRYVKKLREEEKLNEVEKLKEVHPDGDKLMNLDVDENGIDSEI